MPFDLRTRVDGELDPLEPAAVRGPFLSSAGRPGEPNCYLSSAQSNS